MFLLEFIWFSLGIVLIARILLTDPKKDAVDLDFRKINFEIMSQTDFQKKLRFLTWIILFTFFSLTILINYLN